MSLDFYKNNTIHFFLLPSLLTQALLAGVPLASLPGHIGWWLDLYRWEFPLPERDALAHELGRWLAYYREQGALVGEQLMEDHIVVRATSGIVENFREAYLIAARTVSARAPVEWPIAQPALIRSMRDQFATALLLGEVRKPEGSSIVTFGNALSRLEELGYVTTVRRGRGGRERWVDKGPNLERLPELIQHFGT